MGSNPTPPHFLGVCMFYDTPVESLEGIVRDIQRDISWYEKPNRPGTAYTTKYRKSRIAELKQLLKDYRQAVRVLKKVDNDG